MYSKDTPSTTPAEKKITLRSLQAMKTKQEKITMLTAYDFTTARICASAGIDMLLVGDSASNVVCGHSTTLPITFDEMLFLAKNVVRGALAGGGRSMVWFDMPFLSYHISEADAIKNIGRAMKETQASGVKLEGGHWLVPIIKKCSEIGIPVMAHTGLMPQSVHLYGGYLLQGTTEESAKQILNDVVQLEKAGANALLLEKIPAKLAKTITQSTRIPTIGIGAGKDVDGQVLVINDLLGMDEDFKPRFVRRYASLESTISNAIKTYIHDIKTNSFPSESESF